jgi:hypothetical protein
MADLSKTLKDAWLELAQHDFARRRVQGANTTRSLQALTMTQPRVSLYMQGSAALLARDRQPGWTGSPPPIASLSWMATSGLPCAAG